MKLRRLLRTKDPVSSDDERVLTVEESLHSIAIELHRLNKSVGQSNALLGQFVEIAVENHKLVGGSTGTDMMRLVEKIVEPITSMMSYKLGKPATITSDVGPTPPPTVTKEGNGTRVEQAAEV